MSDTIQKELDLSRRQLDCVFQITRALHEQTDIDSIIQRTLLTTLAIVRAEAGSVLLHDARTKELVFKHVVGEKASVLIGTSVPEDLGIAGEVFQSGKPKLAADSKKESSHIKALDKVTGFVTRDMITAPLKSMEGKPIGVIQILNKNDGTFNSSDMKLVEIMGTLAATAIENVRFYETQRLATVSRAVGDISHDLKNMLTPIALGSKVLKLTFDKILDTLPPERRNQFAASVNSILESMNVSAVAVQERMKEITNCVKGIVTQPNFESASINDVAKGVLGTLKTSAENKNIALQSFLEENIPKTLLDTKQIYNALYNLLDNALGATPKGGKVALRTSSQQSGVFPKGNCLIITIEDSGSGIPKNVLDNLFTDQALSTKLGGTGFGTRIAKNVIDAHKGKVEVTSEIGKNTIFTIKLPIKQ